MGINKIMKVDQFSVQAEQPHYRVTIEDMTKNEILYQVESFAGVVSTLETTPEFRRELSMSGKEDIAVLGVTQKLAWGHPMLALFCLDQVKEAIKPHLDKIREFVQTTLRTDAQTP